MKEIKKKLAEVKYEGEGEVKQSQSVSTLKRIHLQKYLNDSNLSKGIKFMLMTKFKDKMYTKEEWKKVIEKEMNRRL